MISQHLRHYSAKELEWRQPIMAWQRKGFSFQQHIAAGGNLLHFISDIGWEGIIDLDSWFSSTMPEHAALSSAAWNVAQLETLFLNCKRPLEGLPDELNYQKLASKGFVKRQQIPDTTWSCLTPQGRVWLYSLPDLAMPGNVAGRLEISHLPASVQLQIGHSFISVSLLKKIELGDVLLVNHKDNIVISEKNVLGRFVMTGEGIMLDSDDDDYIPDEYMDDSDDEMQPELAQNDLVPRNKVKVKIAFTLPKSVMSIAELESLFKGQVLPCELEAEKNISITANGADIARGEMVWIEDRLGIEIKEIYQEAADDSRR